MKKIFFLALLFYVSHLFAAGDDPMVLVFEIDTMNTRIGIPIGAITLDGSVTIDWGDGTDTTVNDTGFVTHMYPSTGTDTVTISGDLKGFGLYRKEMDPSLTTVVSWGDLPLTSLSYAFYSGNGLISVPDSLTSTVTDLSAMFLGTTSFNGDLSNWDVSNVTNMEDMFYKAYLFNGDLSNWDVSNVTNMKGMFYSADSFNRDLNNWDVANVTDMSFMFYSANVFNGDLSSWDVSSVTNMNGMFSFANVFNGDLSSWDVSKVTNMSSMFYEANTFNGDLSNWDVSNVTDMAFMFNCASSFNADISSWDVSSVTNMFAMFVETSSFNADISNWDVSNVGNMRYMFKGHNNFNCDLSKWNVANVREMNNIFDRTALSVTNYDKILINWSMQNLAEGDTLGARSLLYSPEAIDARSSLISDKSWTIFGDSLVETIFTVTYDDNYPGGSATVTEQFSPVARYVSPSHFPKREGCKLLGWNSKPDGTGYAFDNSIKITEDITFYAQWDKGTAIIQTDTTTLTGVKGLLVSPNPVPQSEEKVTLVIPSDLSGSWKIGVYDVLGNVLDDATFEAQGGTTYEWDLRNKSGVKVGSGSYVIMAEHTDDSGNVKTFRRTVGVAR